MYAIKQFYLKLFNAKTTMKDKTMMCDETKNECCNHADPPWEGPQVIPAQIRRVDNLIYYGSMADKYIVMLQILETKKDKDMDVATRVSVQLQLTAPDLKSRDRVVKKTEKDSLYAAMDVGAIWLERALAGK